MKDIEILLLSGEIHGPSSMAQEYYQQGKTLSFEDMATHKVAHAAERRAKTLHTFLYVPTVKFKKLTRTKWTKSKTL